MGFGAKWKRFFEELEAYHGLDTNLPLHIWLLHHLFLDAINLDAYEWAESWNNHRMTHPTLPVSSPRELFFNGMLTSGYRGFQPFDTPLSDQEAVEYGIDWQDYDSPELRSHHRSHNPQENRPEEGDYETQLPSHLSHVEVPEEISPLSPEQSSFLDFHLDRLEARWSRNVDELAAVWEYALGIVQMNEW